MEIKNGFIKDIHGNWVNISHIQQFRIEEHELDKNKKSFYIKCGMMNTLSAYFAQSIETEEEAQKILDNLIGQIN